MDMPADDGGELRSNIGNSRAPYMGSARDHIPLALRRCMRKEDSCAGDALDEPFQDFFYLVF